MASIDPPILEVPVVGPGPFRAALERDVRKVAAAVSAGFVVGVVINGVGSRLAMLLLARLNPAATGRLSDDGFVIGTFDIGNSFGLLLVGGLLGAAGGLVYLAVRPLRFGPGWFQQVALFVGPAVVVGSLLVHTDGIDFRILEPAWLAIALFVTIPGIFAVAVAATADRWAADGAWFARAPRWQAAAGLLPMVPVLPLFAVATAGVLGRRAFADPIQERPRLASAITWTARAGLVAVFSLALARLVGMTLELT